jgi:hypothetical protein
VKRTIDGSDYYYVEYMSDNADYPQRHEFNTGNKNLDYARFINQMFEAQKQYIHVDSCLSYDGTLAGIDAGASVTPAAATGSSVTFSASASVFASDMVGREIWKKSLTGDETGRAVITSYSSGTSVTCEIIEAFYSTDAIGAGDWYLTTIGVSGLGHLEGESVSIIADGGQHPVRTVDSGEITLERQCSVVHVGLGYSGYIQTNSLEGGGTNGTAQTKKKSVNAIGVRFLNSLFAKTGTDYYNLEQIYERTASMKMDRPPLPYTGDKVVKCLNSTNDEYDGGWQREKSVVVAQTLPFPCNVQLISPYMDVSNV